MLFSTSVKQPLIVWVGLLLPSLSLAQNNYVANTANSTTPSTQNTLVGPGAGNLSMSGINNTFLGLSAGQNTSSGAVNTFIGSYAGLANTSGAFNTFLGVGTGASNTRGNFNSFVGNGAGYYNTTGNQNSFMGNSAGYNNSTGYSNVAIGTWAAWTNQTGHNNVMIGDSAGFNTTTDANVYVGSKAGYSNTTGGINTFVGAQAGFSNKDGYANVFVGTNAGYNNVRGVGNMFMGQGAGYNADGFYNMFIGNYAGYATTTGSGNTAIGDGALLNNNVGSHNVAIGEQAGVNNQIGASNVFIGWQARPTGPNISNSVAIGAFSVVSQSNSICLGSVGGGEFVGIGTDAPTTKLHITARTQYASGLRLENLTSASPVFLTGQTKFLTVDDKGNVVLGTAGTGGRSVISELWSANGNTLQNANAGSVVIGQGMNATPTGYKLFVEQGILTEKVKVAVKNTSEWSDKVFGSHYSLKSLAEVERYIKSNKHLPGIPSAQQMVEQGNDLHKTDAKLLEKIEELTLYSIEQQKLIQQQQTEINELKQLMKQVLSKAK